MRVDSIINLSKSSEDAPPLPAAKSTEGAAAAEAAPAVDNPDAIPEVWLSGRLIAVTSICEIAAEILGPVLSIKLSERLIAGLFYFDVVF